MEKTLGTSHTKRSSPSPSTAVNALPVRFSRRTRQRLLDATTSVSESDLEDDDGVEEKIETLQTIVPGGRALEVDELFDETASYILALQCQINAIKVLTAFLERCDKNDDMKFGG